MASSNNPTNSSGVLKLTQQDHLMSKYPGTGNPDTTKHEWAEHQMRDTHATVAASSDLLAYLSIATGLSVERLRSQQLEALVHGCGPAPPPRDYNFLLEDFMPPKKKQTLDDE